jgi:hypothetical protein
MINFDWSLIPGSVLCTVHLMLGLIVGYSACYFAKPDVRPAEAGGDVRQFKSAMDGVLSQVKLLSSLSQSHSATLPPSFFEAIARLIESVTAVQSQLSGRGVAMHHAASAPLALVRSDPPQMDRPLANDTQPIPFDGLTVPLYDELTKGIEPVEAEQGPRAVRRPYHVIQYMAPWDGELPQPAAYQEVVCNDLSTGGISFFTKDLPASKGIAITLGHEHDLLMQAEIVHYQRRQQANSFVYYVGCRFTKRIEHVPDDRKPVTFQVVG